MTYVVKNVEICYRYCLQSYHLSCCFENINVNVTGGWLFKSRETVNLSILPFNCH